MLCILWRALVFLGWMATYLLSEHQRRETTALAKAIVAGVRSRYGVIEHEMVNPKPQKQALRTEGWILYASRANPAPLDLTSTLSIICFWGARLRW
jgi:hypothetical protein